MKTNVHCRGLEMVTSGVYPLWTWGASFGCLSTHWALKWRHCESFWSRKCLEFWWLCREQIRARKQSHTSSLARFRFSRKNKLKKNKHHTQRTAKKTSCDERKFLKRASSFVCYFVSKSDEIDCSTYGLYMTRSNFFRKCFRSDFQAPGQESWDLCACKRKYTHFLRDDCNEIWTTKIWMSNIEREPQFKL